MMSTNVHFLTSFTSHACGFSPPLHVSVGVCVSISAFLIVCSSQLEADWGEMDRWKKRGKIGGKVVEDTVEKREKERDKDEYN